MRILAALPVLSLLLAGCALPEEEAGDPLLGVCPQWEEGPWQEAATGSLAADSANATRVFMPQANGTNVTEQGAFALDLYRLRFTSADIRDAVVEVRAFAHSTGQQRAFQDYRDPERPMSVPVLSIGPDADLVGQEFDIYLTSVAHGAAPAPDALRIEWTLSQTGGSDAGADIAYNVTAAYRICGAPLP